MAVFRPFRATRPRPEFAAQVAALPYDTMSTEEARALVAENPLSFLYVDKAEIALPVGTSLYDDAVYQAAAERLRGLLRDGVLKREEVARFYIYRQTWRGRAQTGLVGCASTEDYRNQVVKKHELTRADKELDRIRHVRACAAHTGPIFLMYRDTLGLAAQLADWCAVHPVECSFTADETLQEIWPITDPCFSREMEEAFSAIPSLYIADGHHRCASAAFIAEEKCKNRLDLVGAEEAQRFLAVAFPEDQLAILDYNRVVQDLNGRSVPEFFAQLSEKFVLEEIKEAIPPKKPHEFSMFLDEKWFRLTAKPGSFAVDDPVKALDVEILQENLLAPILGILDPRRDERIAFIGGIRGLAELEQRCRRDMRVAFALYPTTTAELMNIADVGEIMPPKSTWFEPKLRSGLFIHEL